MGRSTVHYADNETNNILKRLHNKLRPAGTPVERVEYIIELLLLRIFETKLKQDDIFKPLRKIFTGENYRLLFSYIHSLSNGDRILSELNKNIFPFYATILQEARKVIKGNLHPKMQDQLVLMEEVFANSNFTNNVKGGVITEVIGLVNDIDEKYILKTDLLGDAIESALSETGGTKDLGLYRTPDHIRQMMVAMIDPDFTDTVFDPACGTAGFLFDAYDYVIDKSNKTGIYPSTDAANMFYRTGIGGIEYQGRIRKMAAVNMYIRGLNPHNIMQGDSLKMFEPARDAASKTVVIANPPFGAERDQPAYPNVWEEYSKESETTVLFVKLMFDYLKKGGRCAVVVSEGFLTWGQGSACALRKMLLNEANLRAIISLPQGVFVSKSGQGAKTSILYFEKGQPTDFVWYYKIENDGFSMGTNRKPIEGNQIPELLALFEEVKQGKKPEDTPRSFCIDKEQIETLDPQIEERIANETREKTIERNAMKREKKVAELDKKLTTKKISKTVYKEELSQFDSNLEAQVENEIAKAIEKAHTYHFNLQNYRISDDERKTEFPMVELKELIAINNNRIKPINFPQIEFTILGVSKQVGVFVNEQIKGKDIKQSYFDVAKNEFCYNPYRINVGSIGLCKLDIENQIISGAYNIFSCDESKLNPKFLEALFKTPKFLEYVNDKATGGVRMDFKIEFMQGWKIPLPPLEIQNEIVEKVEKQKQIIEGAEKIIDNYEVEVKSDEKNVKMIQINDLIRNGEIKINSGDFLPQKQQQGGEIPVYGGNGIQGNHNESNFSGEVISIGRVGAKCGCVHYINEDCWITDNSFVLQINSNDISPKYLSFILQKENLNKHATITAQPSINQSIIKNITVSLPSLEIQHQIVEKLDCQMAALESVRFLRAEAEKRIEEILAGVWKEKEIMTTLTVVVEENYFVKRKMLGVYIINQSLKDKNFGDTKFEKLMHLTEYWAIKRNFNQQYYKKPAGPYDNKFTFGFYDQIVKSGWFNIQKIPNNQSIITAGKNNNKSQKDYGYFSEEEISRINQLLNLFKNADYKVPEVVSTLYAVWNNRIILQQEISDKLLIQDFYDWDKHKSVYTKEQVESSLNWMREKEILPDGWGKVIEKVKK